MASITGDQSEELLNRHSAPPPTRASVLSPAAIFALLIVVSGLVRLALAIATTGHGFDHWTMQVWTRALVDFPLRDFYGLNLDVPQDHLPGDLLIFAGLGHLIAAIDPGSADRNIPDAVTLKGVAILADLFIGLIVYRIGKIYAGQPTALLVSTTWLFHPAIIFTSSIWGQWDAVSALPLMIAVILARRGGRSTVFAWMSLAYACLIKPQLALVSPFLLVYAWRTGGSQGLKRSGLGIVLGLGLVQIVGSLFQVGLPGAPTRWSLTDRMMSSIEEYDAVTMGAGNIWLLWIGRSGPFSDQHVVLFGLTAQAIGASLFLTGLSVALLIAWRIESPATGLMAGSAIAFMMMFMVMTRMHERYLFPALPFAILAALMLPTLRQPLTLLTLTFTVNLFLAYTNGNATYLAPGLQSDTFYRLNAVVQLAAGIWFTVCAAAQTRNFAGVTNTNQRHLPGHFPGG